MASQADYQGMAVPTNTNQGVLDFQWENQLADIFLHRNPFYGLAVNTGMGNNVSKTIKFLWGEYDEDTPTVTVTDTVSATSHIVVGANEYKYLVKDDILVNMATGSYLMVTTTPTSTSVVCYQITDETGVLELIDTDDEFNGLTYLKIGNSKEIGAFETESVLNAISYFRTVTDQYNYIQMIEHWAKIAESEYNQKWMFKNYTKWQHMKDVMYQHHVDEIERTMWVGRFGVDTATKTNGQYFTKGFFNFSGLGSQTGSLATAKYSDFITFMRSKATLKNDQKEQYPAFANPMMIQFIAKMADNATYLTFDGDGKTDQFGIKVHRLVTPFGDVMIKRNRALKEIWGDTAMLALVDTDLVGLQHLENMNTITRENVAPSRAHFYLAQTYSTVGFQLMNPAMHSYWKLS